MFSPLSKLEMIICYIQFVGCKCFKCGLVQNFLVWEWINPFPNKPWFLCVCSKRLLKTLWVKEKLLIMSNFSFSHSVFYSFGKLSAIFIKIKIVVCKTYEFRSLKICHLGKGLKYMQFEILSKNNSILVSS